MSLQATTPREEVQQKREWLARICADLGKGATPAEIRERAYAEGFGKVSPAMLAYVRDRLWPDRERRKGGGRKWTTRSYCVVREEAVRSAADAEGVADLLPACPACGSRNAKSHGPRKHLPGDRVLRRRECRECGHRWDSDEPAGNLPGRLADKLAAAVATEKTCTDCGRTLPVAEFSPRGDGTHYKRSHCRDCANHKRAAKWEEAFFAGLGISRDDYDRMAESQDHRCAICGCDEATAANGRPRKTRSQRWLRVDHCHGTGRVRALLCDKCNLGIGNFNDDPRLMETAAAYLRQHDAGPAHGKEV